MEGSENVNVDAFIDDVLNNQEDYDTRIEPRSDKENLEAEKDANIELMVTDSTPSSSLPKPKTEKFRRYKSFIQQMGRRYGYMFAHLKKHFMPKKSFHELVRIPQSTIEEALPSMVGDRVNEIAKKTVPLYVVEGLLLDKQKTQANVATMIVEAVQKDARIFGGDYFANEFDAWMDDFGTDDDEVPTEKVSQELWEEISGEFDKTRLQKPLMIC
nr:hypothetical protein [Tanacetum cinerariifolium]